MVAVQVILKRFIFQLAKGYGAYLTRRFHLALKDPLNAQNKVLNTIVDHLKRTEYGQYYGIQTINDFRKQLPIVDYDDIEPWVLRQKKEENAVLVADKVLFYEKTSGSTGPQKYIPYSAKLRKCFTHMFFLWAFDLVSHIKGLGDGQFYFSVSPHFDQKEVTETGVSVGLNTDADYLGAVWNRILSSFMLTDQTISQTRDPEAFKQNLCLKLLSCEALEVISVWNPSFLALVLAWIEEHKIQIISQIGQEMGPERVQALTSEPIDWMNIWPKLKLVSCWADANAEPLANQLAEKLPVHIQGKGLLATESPMTIPMMGIKGCVPLISDIYFEFLGEDNEIYELHQLVLNKVYQIIISHCSGVYRYRIGDQVEVVGRFKQTPTLRFIGRIAQTSDLVGEKLSEAFVQGAIESLDLEGFGYRCLLAVREPENGYVLILDRIHQNIPELRKQIEAQLNQAYHYRHARALGQLSHARVHIVQNIESILAEYAIKTCKNFGAMKQKYLIDQNHELQSAFGLGWTY